MNGGGTPNLWPAAWSLSSMGVFGGLGGGGGPGAGADGTARGGSEWANLPASGSGGGALKRGRGGTGSCGGVGSRWTASALPDLRGAGGGGGAPRRGPDDDILSGSGLVPGGGGGGARDPVPLACEGGGGGGGGATVLGAEAPCSFKNSTMKS